MKPLEEYEPEETDLTAARIYGTTASAGEIFLMWREKHAETERRLAACRDLLACLNSSQCMDAHVHTEITQTLALTDRKSVV